MTQINRSALVEYSAEQMFELVNDIESYPKFMQGCTAARVISRADNEVVAELWLSSAGFSQRFTTRNTLERPRKMTMNLEQGDFSKFDASWEFTPLSEQACKVTLNMDVEFRSGFKQFAAQNLFTGAANAQVDALVRRARKVYGESNSASGDGDSQ